MTPLLKFKKSLPEIIISMLLISATLIVYIQVWDHEFIDLDDPVYITENLHLRDGFTVEKTVWAFTTWQNANWHPVTWLSHMLDYDLYELNPKGHHLTSLLFHIANTLLLFLVLRRMTDAVWKSAFTAALFALHPLHVESVAWVAERKDILSCFFWMLTMWAYIRYVEDRNTSRYILVILFFTLGLMSKPMAITLPFVLLLIDYWPLRRIQPNSIETNKIKGLIIEKLPLFALTAASGIITFLAQEQGGAVETLETFPLDFRIANAITSYVSYIGKMIWPVHLAVQYINPAKALPVWRIAGSSLILLFLSALFLRVYRRRPYALVGWLWFLGTLVPVIGLVQVGIQSMADRYTYIPHIGLFIITAWGVPDLMGKWRHKKVVLTGLSFFVFSLLMVRTHDQVSVWKNSFTLFSHSLASMPENFFLHNNIGYIYVEQGKPDRGLHHFLEALRTNPGPRHTEYNNLGRVYARLGKIDKALLHYKKALRENPGYVMTYYNVGNLFLRQGKVDKAIKQYTQAIEIDPNYPEAHNNLGIALTRKGHSKKALDHFAEAVRLRPDYTMAINNLEIARQEMSRRRNEREQR